MDATPPTMPRRKQLALIAHDNRKADMLEWAQYNRGTLAQHELHATGTTGAKLAAELGLPVHRFLSGPLGGDQQVGAAIAEGRIDFVIFFWDPLEPHPHDVDVKALLRIAASTTCRSPATARRRTSCSPARSWGRSTTAWRRLRRNAPGPHSTTGSAWENSTSW